MRAMRRGFRCIFCCLALRPLLPHGSPSKQGTSERMQMPMSHLVSLVCVVSFFRIVCVALRHKNTTRLAYKHCCSKPHKHHHPPFLSPPHFCFFLRSLLLLICMHTHVLPALIFIPFNQSLSLSMLCCRCCCFFRQWLCASCSLPPSLLLPLLLLVKIVRSPPRRRPCTHTK